MERGSNADGPAAAPATGLPKIIWIRQMLQRWQSTAAKTTGRTSNGSATGERDANAHEQNKDVASANKLPLVVPAPEKEEEHGNGDGQPTTPGAPAGVPRGCCAVYVGAERRRFVVPTAYLGNPVFRRLLEKAEEEFEFEYAGGALSIPCDTESFKYILAVMERHRKGLVVVDHEGNATETPKAAAGGSSSSSPGNPQ
ncbi:auxin-responsive protein SAUR36-like [Hordeum vulgare]|nr:auxin-responsive protein SAUR36-like [Hordeum vulgare]